MPVSVPAASRASVSVRTGRFPRSNSASDTVVCSAVRSPAETLASLSKVVQVAANCPWLAAKALTKARCAVSDALLAASNVGERGLARQERSAADGRDAQRVKQCDLAGLAAG